MSSIFHKISFHSRNLLKNLRIYPKMIFDFWYLKYKGVETEFGYVRLEGIPIISKTKGSRIILGKGCTLVSKSKYNLAGINHPVIIATLTADAIIDIGIVGISGSSLCAAKLIKIGDYSGLGANSCIYDTDFHPLDAKIRRVQNSVNNSNCKEVIIGKDVWIAANVLILKGVEIGDEAIIGAGSVVTGNVPSKTIFAGNPAVKIRDL
jgi:acetyltransferase-like isoleucine patch superfamily enzyme